MRAQSYEPYRAGELGNSFFGRCMTEVWEVQDSEESARQSERASTDQDGLHNFASAFVGKATPRGYPVKLNEMRQKMPTKAPNSLIASGPLQGYNRCYLREMVLRTSKSWWTGAVAAQMQSLSS
jgi:hypothetical protein